MAFDMPGTPWMFFVNLREKTSCLIHDAGKTMHMKGVGEEAAAVELAEAIWKEIYLVQELKNSLN